MARQPASAADIGKAIKGARAARGLTLRDLQGLTGINSALLSQMERGVMEPKPKHFRALHKALRTRPGDLFAA
jgi:transcriptional regulator with XRE-family HTH domain